MDALIAQKRDSYLQDLEASFQDFISMSNTLDDEIMDMLFEKECEEHDKLALDYYN